MSPLEQPEAAKRANARLGYLMVHCGLWLHWRSSQLMLLTKPSRLRFGSVEAYDKGVWYELTWKRVSYLVINALTITLELFFIHISFSNVFSGNLWYFIIGFKIAGIFVENMSEMIFKNNLLLIPISTTIDLMENLCTFGAPDFLEFIRSFVLGLGVQMVERAFIEQIIDKVTDLIKDNLPKIKAYLRK